MTAAEVSDAELRKHLAMLLAGIQGSEDFVVVNLARSEAPRLIGAVLTCIGDHWLNRNGKCVDCHGPHCFLRQRLSQSLLPVHRHPTSRG